MYFHSLHKTNYYQTNVALNFVSGALIKIANGIKCNINSLCSTASCIQFAS